MKINQLLITTILTLISACDKKFQPQKNIYSSTSASFSSSSLEKIISDQWIGRWNGPEGTYLDISGSDGSYILTIKDLDLPRSYQATGKHNVIYFKRNGVDEVIKPTNGAATGMKWLQTKANCLTIREGEGYCRD